MPDPINDFDAQPFTDEQRAGAQTAEFLAQRQLARLGEIRRELDRFDGGFDDLLFHTPDSLLRFLANHPATLTTRLRLELSRRNPTLHTPSAPEE